MACDAMPCTNVQKYVIMLKLGWIVYSKWRQTNKNRPKDRNIESEWRREGDRERKRKENNTNQNFHIISLFGFIFNFIASVFATNAVCNGLMLSFQACFHIQLWLGADAAAITMQMIWRCFAKLFVDYACRFKVTTLNNVALHTGWRI